MLDREGLGLKIYEISRDHADGYRRSMAELESDIERETAYRCACAASNTGYFLLQALGYTKEDMDRFREALDNGREITPNQPSS